MKLGILLSVSDVDQAKEARQRQLTITTLARLAHGSLAGVSRLRSTR